MKFTTSQKICFGLLAVGLCALVADGALGGAGGPELPTAATDVAVVRTATMVTPPKADAPASLTLAARLRLLAAEGGPSASMPDAFAVPADWTRTPAGRPADTSAVAFQASHSLKAVMTVGRRGSVLLNDRLVAVGDSVDGFELIEVRQYHAVFAANGGRTVLELPGLQAAANH